MRALRGNPAVEVDLSAQTERMLRRFDAEHEELRDTIGVLRDASDRLASAPDQAALQAITRAHTATMSRTHAEIQRLSDRIGNQLALAKSSGSIGPDQVDDLLACLYGLYALLRLHFVQEEENYFTLAEDEPGASSR